MNLHDYKSLIDQYLGGELPASQQELLMQSLAADPALKQAFDLQVDIAETLKVQRRQELKNRLRQIPVQGGSSRVGWQQVAGITGLALIVVVGSVLYLTQPNAQKVAVKPASEQVAAQPQVQADAPAADASAPAANAASASAASAAGGSEGQQNNGLANSQKERQAPAAAASSGTLNTGSSKAKNNQPAAASSSESRQDIEPGMAVQAPTELDAKPESIKAGGNSPAPAAPLASASEAVAGAPAISAEKSDKYTFHYKHFDNRLFLYGDFEGKLYELLELRRNGTRNYYLFLEGKYYAIQNNVRKETALSQIQEPRLLHELKALRQRKED
jgi:hypothetical protein